MFEHRVRKGQHPLADGVEREGGQLEGNREAQARLRAFHPHGPVEQHLGRQEPSPQYLVAHKGQLLGKLGAGPDPVERRQHRLGLQPVANQRRRHAHRPRRDRYAPLARPVLVRALHVGVHELPRRRRHHKGRRRQMVQDPLDRVVLLARLVQHQDPPRVPNGVRQVGVPLLARRQVNVRRVLDRVHHALVAHQRREPLPVQRVGLDERRVHNVDVRHPSVATVKRRLQLPSGAERFGRLDDVREWDTTTKQKRRALVADGAKGDAVQRLKIGLCVERRQRREHRRLARAHSPRQDVQVERVGVNRLQQLVLFGKGLERPLEPPLEVGANQHVRVPLEERRPRKLGFETGKEPAHQLLHVRVHLVAKGLERVAQRKGRIHKRPHNPVFEGIVRHVGVVQQHRLVHLRVKVGLQRRPVALAKVLRVRLRGQRPNLILPDAVGPRQLNGLLLVLLLVVLLALLFGTRPLHRLAPFLGHQPLGPLQVVVLEPVRGLVLRH